MNAIQSTNQEGRIYTAIVKGAQKGISNLTNKELDNYNQLPEDKRGDWLLGRQAAKQVVVDFLESNHQEIDKKRIEIISSGGPPKVFVYGESGVYELNAHLSISHCGGVAAAKIIDKNDVIGLGVDLERVRTFKDETIKSFMSEQEYKTFLGLPTDKRPLFCTRLWCLKEAYLKALGVGLSIHPQRVEIWDTPDGVLVRKDGRPTTAQAKWTIEDELYILATITL